MDRKRNTPPQTKRAVMVIGIDGCRRDLFYEYVLSKGRPMGVQSLNAWNLNHDYASCEKKRIVPQSGELTSDERIKKRAKWKTMAGWTATITGMNNDKTHVIDNGEQSMMNYWTMNHRSFLEYAYANGYRTCAVGRPNVIGCGKSHNDSGVLDYTKLSHWSSVAVRHGGPTGDEINTTFVIDHIGETDAAFVHLDSTDQAGHAFGWGSDEYMDAIRLVDENVERLVHATQNDGREWLILLTSDHGGFGLGHGHDELWDQCIPFLSNLPLKGSTARQYDAAPTAMAYLGVKHPKMDGKNML